MHDIHRIPLVIALSLVVSIMPISLAVSAPAVPPSSASSGALSQITENRKVESRKSLIFRNTTLRFCLKKANLRQSQKKEEEKQEAKHYLRRMRCCDAEVGMRCWRSGRL